MLLITDSGEKERTTLAATTAVRTNKSTTSMLSSKKQQSSHPQLAEVNSIAQLIDLWLHGKSVQSQRAYRRDVNYFLAFIEHRDLRQTTLNDLQDFADALAQQGYSAATQNRRLSAIKSLINFGCRIGYLSANVGALVDAPPVKNTLAERILSEAEVRTIIDLEPDPRNKLLLQFLYFSGARVAEVATLRWRDLKRVGDRGQATLLGKGGKTRAIALPAALWQELVQLCGNWGRDEPVFRSRKQGGALQPNQIRVIVARAGERAGLEGVSPHWFRHSHASHSLQRGASIALVQQSLGHSDISTTARYLHVNPDDGSGLYLPV